MAGKRSESPTGIANGGRNGRVRIRMVGRKRVFFFFLSWIACTKLVKNRRWSAMREHTSSVGGTTSAGATGKRGRRCAFLRNLDQRCLLAVTRRNACTMMPCTSVISHCLPPFPYHSTPYFARPTERERKREIDRERDPSWFN